ncbi:MAG TPA: serine/threonine-protein kinase [Terriglobales bacterium]|nr:serine/threonine-protein kinase [Terriglobales bacterium]
MVPTVEKIGRYEIVSELGRGAMGLVYRAVDPNIGRTVALKTMRVDVHGMEHEEMLRRFKNEARAAGLMNHPNIVTIYDAGEVDGLFYIAMEYLEGETVQSLMMQKRVLPAEQIVEIGVQVCAGLEYAHQMKVIHRDIKPANIMITRQNVAKIMDFGISKAAGTMTNTSQVLGTPNYMAPEQVKGLDLDGRADLFSFGVVLYEMATGERPFAGQNVTTIIYKIVNEKPVAPSDKEASVHPGLSAVIARCLSKDPSERYTSAADLARDLANYRSIGADGEDTSVIPNSVRAQATQPVGPPTGTWKSSASTNGNGAGAASSGTLRRQTIKQTTGMMRRAGVRPNRLRDKNVLALTAFAVAIVVVMAGLYRVKHRAPAAPLPAMVAQLSVPAPPPATTPIQPVKTTPEPAAKAEHTGVQESPKVAASTPATAPKSDADAKIDEPRSEQSEPEKLRSQDGKREVKFRSNPEGAFIQIDGQSSEAWVTPFTTSDIAPGSHEVVFTKVGYSPETRTFEIGAKSSSYKVNLVPVTTAIAITSDPPGAEVEIDGHDTTRVTPAQIPVAEGEHNVLVRLEGFRSAELNADVKKGQIYQFHPMLNPAGAPQAGSASRLSKLFGGGFRAKGVIDFVSSPPGARIFIHGRAAQIATPAHDAFAPGDYSIELREQGYKPVKQIVHVEPGKISKVEALLEPQQ